MRDESAATQAWREYPRYLALAQRLVTKLNRSLWGYSRLVGNPITKDTEYRVTEKNWIETGIHMAKSIGYLRSRWTKWAFTWRSDMNPTEPVRVTSISVCR